MANKVNYTRTVWRNRAVQNPRTYEEVENAGGGITHVPLPGKVAQQGTPLNENNLNNIEQGIVDLVNALNGALDTISQIQTALSECNTEIGNNARAISDIQKVNESQSTDISNVTQAHNELAEDVETLEGNQSEHAGNTSNPHKVSKAQVGLGDVPNVSTNNQTPTYAEATSDQNLSSGEKLSAAMGKIARAVKSLWNHLKNFNNPHKVSKNQVGLGSVPNVTTNNQTPTYTIAERDAKLSSGETLAAAFGKLARAVTTLHEHIESTDNPHNTGLFDAAAVSFSNEWGEPDAFGSFVGSGIAQTTLTVNGKTCKGQWINLGFAPSRVAILIPGDDMQLGMSESELNTNTGNNMARMLLGRNCTGLVLIGPGQNYYHSGCGNYRTSAPEAVLVRDHGGAVVYGNGFIVQSYNGDTDSVMRMNNKGVRYTYMAWK